MLWYKNWHTFKVNNCEAKRKKNDLSIEGLKHCFVEAAVYQLQTFLPSSDNPKLESLLERPELVVAGATVYLWNLHSKICIFRCTTCIPLASTISREQRKNRYNKCSIRLQVLNLEFEWVTLKWECHTKVNVSPQKGSRKFKHPLADNEVWREIGTVFCFSSEKGLISAFALLNLNQPRWD